MDSLVSIVVPVYNREAYVARALDSIVRQTYENWQVVVVDDHSSDKSIEVVENFARKDERIRIIHHRSNRGAQAARNTGIRSAKGEWIAFLDSDDEWLPNWLEKGLYAQEKTGFSIIHCDCYRTGGNEPPKRWGLLPLTGNVYKALLEYPGIMFQGLLVQRTCLERIGYLDEDIVSYQEWDTSIMLAKYYEFGFVPEPLFIYHCHSSETISKDMKRDADGWAQIVEKHKSEIDKVAGRVALQNHYQILAQKYYSTMEHRVAEKYFRKAFHLSGSFKSKIQNMLKMNLVHYGINPKYANLRKYLGWIKRRLFTV